MKWFNKKDVKIDEDVLLQNLYMEQAHRENKSNELVCTVRDEAGTTFIEGHCYHETSTLCRSLPKGPEGHGEFHPEARERYIRKSGEKCCHCGYEVWKEIKDDGPV